jgi:hypothetical protein
MTTKDKYKIYDISEALPSGAVEHLGSKRKGWLPLILKPEDENARYLFKQGTKDKCFNVLAYAKNALTPIFDEKGCALNTFAVVKSCEKYAPKATKYWIKKIEAYEE